LTPPSPRPIQGWGGGKTFMPTIEIIILGILGFLILEQMGVVGLYLWNARNGQPQDLSGPQPNTLVVMTLRGKDPNLEQCLRSLLDQDYDNYRVRLVVDHPEDPSWEVVKNIIKEKGTSRVDLQALEDPRKTCSLKCSALLQATADLEPGCEVVAFLDSDVTPHRKWLRQLVAPLSDPEVGATVGNRWFLPEKATPGTLVRHLLNIVSVVNLYLWNIPWAGCLAMRADLLRSHEVRNVWSRSASDDVPLSKTLAKLKVKLKYLPNLVLVDRSDCELAQYTEFISRQYLWIRLYHPRCFWVCNTYRFVFLIFQAMVLFLVGKTILQGRWDATLLFSFVFLGSFLLDIVIAQSVDSQKRSVLGLGGSRFAFPWWKVLKSIPLALFISNKAALKCLFTRRINWRGVDYEIKGPWYVRLVEYRPLN